MLHILLAEDNLGDVFLVEEALAEHQIGHELHVVHDAQAALDYVMRIGESNAARCPDLMLLDLNLPKGEGFTVLRESRSLLGCTHTPVIIVTSSDSTKDRERMAQLGISYYFRKPSDYEEYMQLGAIVKQVLAGQVK